MPSVAESQRTSAQPQSATRAGPPVELEEEGHFAGKAQVASARDRTDVLQYLLRSLHRR
jgi:hypothetical protein